MWRFLSVCNCPEGAFCVGSLIKNAVRSSVRPSVRAQLPQISEFLARILKFVVFRKFGFESSKAQNMRAGRVDEIHLSNFLNVCDSKFNLLKIRDNYIKIRTFNII